MATKKASKKKIKGDSPVTVGGGRKRVAAPSFDLSFNKNVYLSDPHDTDNWISSEPSKLDYVMIDGVRYPAAGSIANKVVISYGSAGKITFKGVPAAVRFKGTELPYQNGKHHGAFLLKKVKVDSDNDVPVVAKSIIVVHTK